MYTFNSIKDYHILLQRLRDFTVTQYTFNSIKDYLFPFSPRPPVFVRAFNSIKDYQILIWQEIYLGVKTFNSIKDYQLIDEILKTDPSSFFQFHQGLSCWRWWGSCCVILTSFNSIKDYLRVGRTVIYRIIYLSFNSIKDYRVLPYRFESTLNPIFQFHQGLSSTDSSR